MRKISKRVAADHCNSRFRVVIVTDTHFRVGIPLVILKVLMMFLLNWARYLLYKLKDTRDPSSETTDEDRLNCIIIWSTIAAGLD